MSSTNIEDKVLRKRNSKMNNKIRTFVKLDKLTPPPKKRKYRRRNLDNPKKSQHQKKIDPAAKRSLEYFWKQTESTYYSQNSKNYIDTINQVHHLLTDPKEDGAQKFSNFECFLSFENLIAPEYGNHIRNIKLREANRENLIDMYRLNTLTLDQIDMNTVNIPKVRAEVEAWIRNAPSRNSDNKAKKHTKYFLSEERAVIKRIQNTVGLKHQRKISPSSINDKSIDKTLGELEKQFKEFQNSNANAFEE